MSRHEDPAPSKEDIDAIFSKYCVEEYIPEGANTQKNQPKYTPTPLNAGPKPLTIEEYLERNQKRKKEEQKRETKKKTKRGGKKLQIKKQRRELVRLIGLSHGQEKRKLYIELQRLNGQSKIQIYRSHHSE